MLQPDLDLGPEPTLAVLAAVPFEYDRWRAVITWYRVTNDEDPDSRYYLTVTQWWGKGVNGGESETGASPPGGQDTGAVKGFAGAKPWVLHDNSQMYHDARGWAADGDTFLHDFNPLDHDAGGGSGAWTLTIGWFPSASYTWTQDRDPASFRYQLWDYSPGGYDDQMFGNRATFEDGSHTGKFEYGASGVVPTGNLGYMYVLAEHTYRESCFGWCIPEWHTETTGWQYRPINWT